MCCSAAEDLRKFVAEAAVEQRTTFMIEELMRVRRVGFEASGGQRIGRCLLWEPSLAV